MRMPIARLAVFACCLALLGAGCKHGPDDPSATAKASTSSSNRERTVGTGACPPQQRTKPRIVSAAPLARSATDRTNHRFDPPGAAQPALSAEEALERSQPNALVDSVDAVLAVWTRLAPGLPDAAPRLVWVLRNVNVAVAPSRGPRICGEIAWVADAATGDVHFGYEGNALL